MLVSVNLLQRNTVGCEERVEQVLQRWPAQRFLNERGNVSVLGQNLDEMLVTESRHRLDRAELLRLRSAGRAEVAAELGEALWRQCLESGELSGDDPHESIDAFHGCYGAERVAFRQTSDKPAQLVQYELEPKLAGLVNDYEEQLVGMLR
jgi:hypothetical protein